MDTADKEWIEATLSIDGAEYERVGMRLKGNSSLMMLRGGPEGGPMTRRFGPDGEEAAAAPAEPEDAADGRDVFASDEVDSPEPMQSALSAEEPEGLPWLIRLDKYVDDQNHNGVFNLVIRSNRSATALNESVALELLDAAGLASQRATPARFTVNDRAPTLPAGGRTARRCLDGDALCRRRAALQGRGRRRLLLPRRRSRLVQGHLRAGGRRHRR